MASTQCKSNDPLEFECIDPDNPNIVKFYADLGSNGQWYLNLNEGSWVLQPAQDSNNDNFLAYIFRPSQSVEGVVYATNQTEDKNYKGNCLEAASASELGVGELPEEYLSGWHPAQPFLFNAKSPDDVNGYIMESLQYPDSYLTYGLLTDSTCKAPVNLENARPNWFNQVFDMVDTGGYDGTQKFFFKLSDSE